MNAMDKTIEKMDAMNEMQLRQWCLERGLEKPFGFGIEATLETATRYYEFVARMGGVDKEGGGFAELKRLFDGEVERIKTTPFVASFVSSLMSNDAQAHAKAITIARLLDGETVAQGEYILEQVLRLVRRTHNIDAAVFNSWLERE